MKDYGGLNGILCLMIFYGINNGKHQEYSQKFYFLAEQIEKYINISPNYETTKHIQYFQEKYDQLYGSAPDFPPRFMDRYRKKNLAIVVVKFKN